MPKQNQGQCLMVLGRNLNAVLSVSIVIESLVKHLQAATSAPCVAGGTLNWYLYDDRPKSLYALAIQYDGQTKVVSAYMF
jgi:hypothetical protein